MHFGEYNLGGVTDYAAFVFVRIYRDPPPGAKVGEAVKGTRNHVPLGYVFIVDPKFGHRAQWKMPAGHVRRADLAKDDPPLATAMRELEGEAGIRTPAENFRYVGKWLSPGWRDRRGVERPAHWKILFLVSVSESDRDWLNSHQPENEGEVPKFFSQDEFERVVAEGGFMQSHLDMIGEHHLVALGRKQRTA